MTVTSHPGGMPLDQWPQGWLVLEVASLLNWPRYLVMTPLERSKWGLPSTHQEMREFIRARHGD